MLWIAFAGAAAGWSVDAWRRAHRPGEVLAYTECPMRGPARVVVGARVTAADSAPVRAHEAVHAAQCATLGPVRYRWDNLFAAKRLRMEAPAYCAGAMERLKAGQDTAAVRRRIRDDMIAAMGDSIAVRNALSESCPLLLGPD